MKFHVLLFGNDSHINDYNLDEVDRLRSGAGNIITVGINRIWRRYWPDYLVFIDADVVNELIDIGVTPPPDTTIITSEYLFNNSDRPLSKEERQSFQEYLDSVPGEVHMFERPVSYTKRKSSLLWSIVYVDKYLFEKDTCTFYLYGTSLRMGVGHFWLEDADTVYYSKDAATADNEYRSHTTGLKELRKNGFHILSLTKGSRADQFLESLDLNPESLVIRLQSK